MVQGVQDDVLHSPTCYGIIDDATELHQYVAEDLCRDSSVPVHKEQTRKGHRQLSCAFISEFSRPMAPAALMHIEQSNGPPFKSSLWSSKMSQVWCLSSVGLEIS